MDQTQVINQARQRLAAGDFAGARAALEALLAQEPGHGGALELLGLAAGNQGDFRAAAAHLDSAAQAGAGSPELYYNLAVARQKLGEHEAAIAAFSQAVALRSYFFEAHHDLGLSLAASGNASAAIAAFDAALKLRPGSFEALYNKGKALSELDRFADEIDCYQRAIQLRPNFAGGYVNLGVALRDLHRFDEAMRHFKKAVTLDANDALARCNRAQTNLLMGVFDHGWREYEWRWLDGTPAHRLPGKPWLGEGSLAGKTIVLHNEQGFGDTIQFARYVPAVAAMGARVILQVQPALVPLLQGLPGVAELIAEGDQLPAFDCHCPLMSLPLAFRTSLATIPPAPYLNADPALSAAWRARLEADSAAGRRPRIGLVWSGSTWHRNDRNRSLALDQLRPLLAADASFVSLQKDVRAADSATLESLPQLMDVSGEIASFADTAALIDNLDLVISVDTAVAHLAGALGKPVWLLLPFSPDWRWLLERKDSPWYPGMRLFRQAAMRDWNGPLDELGAALAALPEAHPRG
ncbi:tetratricopeptide repeat protein [Cupriavidus sp. 2TAF22]|uniref:glycosyltransferase family 9 protein n=1 Tax=unclassified Cupriavidus TaxID=2640874 RepID=UPI003F8F1787